MGRGVVQVNGRRVREARLSLPHENGRPVSQFAFAHKVGCHWVTISKIETGAANAGLDTLARIAEVTGQPIDHFLGSDEDEEDAAVRARRIAAELVLRGEDDLAADLLRLIPKQEPVGG